MSAIRPHAPARTRAQRGMAAMDDDEREAYEQQKKDAAAREAGGLCRTVNDLNGNFA